MWRQTLNPDEKRHKEDLDESISDLVFVLGELGKVKDIVQDSSTYSYGLPKRNTLIGKEVNKVMLSVKQQIKIAQRMRSKYGN
jgi:hypothetical protein